jgi:hypothetical protein
MRRMVLSVIFGAKMTVSKVLQSSEEETFTNSRQFRMARDSVVTNIMRYYLPLVNSNFLRP